MKGSLDSKSEKSAQEKHVLEALFKSWSSHPESLKEQRLWMFVIGFIPVMAVVAIVAFLLTGASGWKILIEHPTVFFWVIGGAFSLSLGMIFSFALLHLFARLRFATKTNDPDSLPFPIALIILFAFFWVIPACLSLVQSKWGIQFVPSQLLFVLNALCFAPFVLLLLWIRFYGRNDDNEETKKPRRHIWFILGTFLIGLVGLSFVGDFQSWAHSLRLPKAISGISTLTFRIAVLTALLPLSMICYAVWFLFYGTIVKDEKCLDASESTFKNVKRKPFWHRIFDFLFGHSQKTEELKPETNDKPPKWLEQLCSRLPDGVKINSKKPPNPDLLPSDRTSLSKQFSSLDTEERESKEEEIKKDINAFWMLMGGKDDCRPTDLQMQFFKRFRNSVEESWKAASNGNEIFTDIILSGDEGTGRTEALLAAAIYAAFVRRQRVLYLVADPNQAKTLCDKANHRFSEILLNCFLGAGILDERKALSWVNEIKSQGKAESNFRETKKCEECNRVPPNILFATPRDIEHIFFEGCGVDADGSSIEHIRTLLQLFEVVLVDDFMEFDTTERSHLPFILHKLRLILVSGNLRPQFVVVTPRLRDECINNVVERLFGYGFVSSNAITLLPRECKPAWSLPLIVKDGLNINVICEQLIKSCMELMTDDGKKLKIVLYRKGLHPHQCKELLAKIAPYELQNNLQIVSRIDDIDASVGADAVLYLTSLAGCADMALRLSVGDEKTVYISLSSESEGILRNDGVRRILPAVPDSTAVALRIHHLRSLLRFIKPGQPMPPSVWERFGVFISGTPHKVDIPEGAIVFEKWRKDEWAVDKYEDSPLWPYVAFEGDRSVKSNAGTGTDFGVLPFTDEDVVQLGDEPLIGLVRPKVNLNGEFVNDDLSTRSLANWIDSQGISRGKIDFAHAETLVFGRSALGDNYSAASCATVTKAPLDTVFTVKNFEAPNSDDNNCVCNIRMTPWNGDGMDFDIPVRTISWFVEPVSVPNQPNPDSARAFTFFHMPDCRNVLRVVSGVIVGLINRIGKLKPMYEDERWRKYSYQAYLSGLLIAPRKLRGEDAIAQIQRGVVGTWSTDNEAFSVVLTHLLTGVLIRIVPDLPFYACIPVFHQRGKDSAVAAAVAWIVQPRNSGRTVEDLLQVIFLKPNGQAELKEALLEARNIFESYETLESKLRWLRSFSRSAFAFDLEEPGAEEAFQKDITWSLEVLSVLEERISGNLKEIEEFSPPVPAVTCDYRWISESKSIDLSDFQPEMIWAEQTEFPSQPELERSGVTYQWHYCGKEFSLSIGFKEGDCKRYIDYLDNSFTERTTGDCFTEYGFNDPYREFIGVLCKEFRKMIDKSLPNANPTQVAEFLLSFVQEGLPYVPDPENKKSDWPRYPSETIMRFGGDCEDSSILYAELLRQFHIGSAVLTVSKHAAVGVDVPMGLTADHKEPVVFEWLGNKYIYAETANNKFTTPLGAETELVNDFVLAEVIPTPDLIEDNSTTVRILNAVAPASGSVEVTLVAPNGTNDQLAVVVFARPRKGVFDAPNLKSYPCVGGAKLPALAERKVYTATLNLQSPDFQNWWYDIFVCEEGTGIVRGHFVGIARY